MPTIISPHPFSRFPEPHLTPCPKPVSKAIYMHCPQILHVPTPSSLSPPNPHLHQTSHEPLSILLPRLCPLSSPKASFPGLQPLLVHVACEPTTPDPACGLSIRIEHTKTCLQTQTWTEGLSTQTQHPQFCRWTQRPSTPNPPPPTLSVDSTLRPSTSDPTCRLSTKPLPVHAAPGPSNQIQLSGSFLWTRRPDPTLPALPADRDPAPGRPLSPLASPRHLPGAVRCCWARRRSRCGRRGTEQPGPAGRSSPAVRGPAVPSRTEPCRTAPCRPAVRRGGGRGAQPRPGATQHGSRGGARAGAARRGPGSGLALRWVCPAHAGGAGGSASLSRAAATPPPPQGRSARGGGVFAQHGQVG